MEQDEIQTLLYTIRNHLRHVVVVGGNIFDQVTFPGKVVNRDVLELLECFTVDPYQNFVVYDEFNGLRTVRAAPALAAAFAPQKKKQTADHELLAAVQMAQTDVSVRESPLAAMRRMHPILTDKKIERTVFVINFAESVFSQRDVSAQGGALRIPLVQWAHDERISERGHLVILLGKEAHCIGSHFLDHSGSVRVIRLSKPDMKRRTGFVTGQVMNAVPGAGIVGKDDVAQPEVLDIARAASGLSLSELGRLMKDLKGSPLSEMSAQVYERKRALLTEEYGEVLEVLSPRYGFEAIGGLEAVIDELQNVAKAMRDGDTSLVPQGILFNGPPGTGKTAVAEALAKECGIGFVRMKDIKSKFVGESEQRMSRFLGASIDLSPVIVFIDEFDQNQGPRGGFDGDSGVSRALFKKLLEAMSDQSQRGRVLWIIASNRPDLIDAAIKRPGRCDLRIPFLPPDVADLAKICPKAFVQYPDMRHDVAEWSSFAARCEGMSGAQIIEVIRCAWKRARKSGRAAVTADDLAWARADFMWQGSDRREVARMALMAIRDCSSRSQLPANHEELVQRYADDLVEPAVALVMTASRSESEEFAQVREPEKVQN